MKLSTFGLGLRNIKSPVGYFMIEAFITSINFPHLRVISSWHERYIYFRTSLHISKLPSKANRLLWALKKGDYVSKHLTKHNTSQGPKVRRHKFLFSLNCAFFCDDVAYTLCWFSIFFSSLPSNSKVGRLSGLSCQQLSIIWYLKINIKALVQSIT